MGLQLTFSERGAALVYGGSGGAGSAICEALAQAGVAVAFTYFSGVKRAEATLARLRDLGHRSSAHALDGRDTAAVRAWVDEAAETYGGLHSVIYAGGPAISFMPISQVPPEHWQRTVEADLHSVFNLIHAAMPHLRSSRGSFIACTTFANRRVLDFDGLSAAPKAAVDSLIRQLAAEEGVHGVRANAVSLGWINVGAGSLEGGETSVAAQFGTDAMELLRQQVRLKRPGTGPELANAVVFLASQQASYISGQTLIVDGGWSV